MSNLDIDKAARECANEVYDSQPAICGTNGVEIAVPLIARALRKSHKAGGVEALEDAAGRFDGAGSWPLENVRAVLAGIATELRKDTA